jgi:hypothetical protein
MLRRSLHGRPDGRNEFRRHGFVKQVRHRVHKYSTRLSPTRGYAERLLIKA